MHNNYGCICSMRNILQAIKKPEQLSVTVVDSDGRREHPATPLLLLLSGKRHDCDASFCFGLFLTGSKIKPENETKRILEVFIMRRKGKCRAKRLLSEKKKEILE